MSFACAGVHVNWLDYIGKPGSGFRHGERIRSSLSLISHSGNVFHPAMRMHQ